MAGHTKWSEVKHKNPQTRRAWIGENPRHYGESSVLYVLHGDPARDHRPVEIGRIKAEVIKGNVVITVERTDEARFGPVSVVVV